MIELIRIPIHIIVTIRNTHIVTTAIQPRVLGGNIFKINGKRHFVVRVQLLSVRRLFQDKTTICQHVNTVAFHSVGSMIRIFVTYPLREITSRDGTCFADSVVCQTCNSHGKCDRINRCGKSARLKSRNSSYIPRNRMCCRVIYATFICTDKCIIFVKRSLNRHTRSIDSSIISILYGVINAVSFVGVCFINRHIHLHICFWNHLFGSNHIPRTHQHTKCTEPTVEILRRATNISFLWVKFCGGVVTVPHKFTLTIDVGNQL